MPYVSKRTIATAFLAAVVTALVLGAVVLFVRRDDNAPIYVMLPTPAQDEATAGGGPSQAELKVYVSGAVRSPGVYTLRTDDRLSDAMAAAGGAIDGAELAAVNLALRLQDEGHYVIPRAGETPPPVSSLAPGQSLGTPSNCDPADEDLINLNATSAALLEALPGIGQARAGDNVSYREQNGPFQSVDEVTNVSGIGPVTYENIRELVTVCEDQ